MPGAGIGRRSHGGKRLVVAAWGVLGASERMVSIGDDGIV
jgi:hypothetical protein